MNQGDVPEEVVKPGDRSTEEVVGFLASLPARESSIADRDRRRLILTMPEFLGIAVNGDVKTGNPACKTGRTRRKATWMNGRFSLNRNGEARKLWQGSSQAANWKVIACTTGAIVTK